MSLSMLIPNSPVDEDSVVWACRALLFRNNDSRLIEWRIERHYSDNDLIETLNKTVTHKYAQKWLNPQSYSTLDVSIAQDVILAGLPYNPLPLISSLEQLGITFTSSQEDIVTAWGLYDFSEFFDYIRNQNFPLTEIRIVFKILGEDQMRAAFRAGLSSSEIIDQAYTGVPFDQVLLETMTLLHNEVKEF